MITKVQTQEAVHAVMNSVEALTTEAAYESTTLAYNDQGTWARTYLPISRCDLWVHAPNQHYEGWTVVITEIECGPSLGWDMSLLPMDAVRNLLGRVRPAPGAL
jgi:hypothetical protein